MANEGPEGVRFADEVLGYCGAFRHATFLAIVDKVTRDDTRELLDEHAKNCANLRVIWAPENREVVDAYVRGYHEALALHPDWILEIDAGFSHQPSDIPLLFQKMGQGYDCVFGSRFCPGGSIENSSRQRYWISYGGTLLANLVLGTRLYDMTSGFQLFAAEALRMILNRGIRSRGPFFQTEMKTYCRHLAIAEVPIRYTAASHPVGRRAIQDAISNLGYLFRRRLSGEL